MNKQTTLFNNLYPWLIWFLGSCFIFYKYVLQVSPSVMVPELMSSFHLTGEALGSLAAFYYYAYLCMQLPAGILLDKFNPRYLMSAAVFVCACGAFLFSTAANLTTAEIGRLLIGIGGAFSAVGTMKLISIWFPANRFALVSGLMMTMAMLGAIGGEAPLGLLVDHLNWRHAILICGLVGFGLALLLYLFIRDRSANNDLQSNLDSKRIIFLGLLKIFRNKQSWLISLYSGLAFAPISAFAGLWGIPFIMQKYGFDRELTATLVSIAFIGFAIGSPLGGWLSDRIGRRKPIMITGTSVSLMSLSLIIYHQPMSAFYLGALFGLFGFASSFFFVSFAHIREINNPKLSGSSIGFINMFDALLGALFEPFIGWLLDIQWHHKFVHGVRIFSITSYEHALVVLPLGLALALLLQCFIQETFCQTARDSINKD